METAIAVVSGIALIVVLRLLLPKRAGEPDQTDQTTEPNYHDSWWFSG